MMAHRESATESTVLHYRNPDIKNTILRISADGEYSQCGNGDFAAWYRMDKGKLRHLNLADSKDYDYITARYRSLYWSLNFFKPGLYNLDYNLKLSDGERIEKKDSPRISREHTIGYTFGVDIDKCNGCDIHASDVKEAVEDMAQFFADDFMMHAPNSVYAAYSGGGIYVYAHHKVFEQFLNQDLFETDAQRGEGMTFLLEMFALAIEDIRKRFFVAYPHHVDKAKPDSLNGSKRVFKSIFSIHKELPYSVIPLDPHDIKINFDDARIPLTQDIINRGKDWYAQYDAGDTFLQYLRSYETPVKEIIRTRPSINALYEKSDVAIDANHYPSCIKNFLAMQSCGEGATRALALLVAFLGQVGVNYDDAANIWYDLAYKWDAKAATSNIFDAYYQIMHTPTCRKLTADNNVGYPGTSIKILNVCKPTMKCNDIVSPRYYADENANRKRLLNRVCRLDKRV